LEAWNFAADAHGEQQVPGSTRPYLSHIGAVTMEVIAALAARSDVDNPDLCVQCAILHDVVEDTALSAEDIAEVFGPHVAAGVSALTKQMSAGDKRAQMVDSLERIKAQPQEVWMVKLADRITNLQPPPKHWDKIKIAKYLESAELISAELGSACTVLGPRIQEKIERYRAHC
jgi:(p)ppGpp synthase/HD superfamily hydrolase